MSDDTVRHCVRLIEEELALERAGEPFPETQPFRVPRLAWFALGGGLIIELAAIARHVLVG